MRVAFFLYEFQSVIIQKSLQKKKVLSVCRVLWTSMIAQNVKNKINNNNKKKRGKHRYD